MTSRVHAIHIKPRLHSLASILIETCVDVFLFFPPYKHIFTISSFSPCLLGMPFTIFQHVSRSMVRLSCQGVLWMMKVKIYCEMCMVSHAGRTEERFKMSVFLAAHPASLIDAQVYRMGFMRARVQIFVGAAYVCIKEVCVCLCVCTYLSSHTLDVCMCMCVYVCVLTVLFVCTMPVGMWRPSQPCQGQLRRGWQPGKMMMMKLKFCARQKGLPRFHWRLCASICSSI